MTESEPKLRVLVVEDEASIRVGLCDVLRFRGFEVEAVEDGLAALSALDQAPWDLVLLDVMLPELDGFSVCERLRKSQPHLPVLMLTAKGSEDDVLRGFDVGADDYVTKPFSVRELLARVQALLKRTRRLTDESFRAGPLCVDPGRRVASVEDEHYELSLREVRILRLLSEDPGRIVSRRVLLRDAWDMNNVDQVETRTVDVHIAKLRKKLGKHGERLVQTVRGQGYRLWTGEA